MPHIDKTINYIEFPLVNAAETMQFYGTVFGWKFQEWGPNYLSFNGAGIEGGFNGEDEVPVQRPGVLVILFSDNLEKVLTEIKSAGATITREIYTFPGGRRFHFTDPNGNELAIWAEASE